MQNWRLNHYVFENFGADDGEGYAFSSSATPLYHWGALTGFIGLQSAGFYSYFNASAGTSPVLASANSAAATASQSLIE